jgi:RNA-directed DNA polymerase
MAQGGCVKEPDSMSQPVDGRSPRNEAKPFCISKKEVWEAYQRVAEEVRKAIAARLRDCRLELHPEKTKIVYCKDELRKGRHDHEKLDFLGYEFRPRRSKSRTGKAFLNFSPAISTKAAKAIRERIRSWKLPKGSDEAIEELSRLYNPIIRGWFQYYGRFYRTALYSIKRQLDQELVFWAKRKYKKLRQHLRRARHWIARISRRCPELFAHWQVARNTAP